ncbi:hypothetical protein J6590_010254 [Homalodisca vitripennis]|nr:hypothetical protein J6590_010254 [Homalodisca vitripennis]
MNPRDVTTQNQDSRVDVDIVTREAVYEYSSTDGDATNGRSSRPSEPSRCEPLSIRQITLTSCIVKSPPIL